MKNKNKNNSLSCGCGHCNHAEHDICCKKNLTLREMFKYYGKDFLCIITSVILLVISEIISFSFVANFIIKLITASLCGFTIIYDMIKGFLNKQFLNENTLMVIAVITSFCINIYAEGVVIVILYSVGELFERIATDSSKRKIAGLAELKSSIVHIITKEGIIDIEPENVVVNSLIEIRKGEIVPIDSVLLCGIAEFDTKTITGESKIKVVEFGSSVISGYINIGDPIIVKTVKKYVDSTVEKIIDSVENSLENKAKTQKFISTFSKIYTPIVVALAFFISLVPPLFDEYNFVKWLYKALSFLVISCPCALVISVPLAFFVGIGSLAKKGILVKGGNYIEKISKINTIVFDKTGTITTGNYKISNIYTYNSFDTDEIINYVCALEEKSTHPIADLFKKIIPKTKYTIENVKEIVGMGLVGNINGKEVVVGNKKIANKYEVNIDQIKGIDDFHVVAVNGVLASAIFLEDELKENITTCIEKVEKQGVKNIYMLTGDNRNVSEKVAHNAGIKNVYSELSPVQKVDILKSIINKSKENVMFVGDGINDAPSIAMADVGVAMGDVGSEIAIDSADVVIMDDDILKISNVIKFSKKIKRTVMQNIIGSLLIKFAIMVLSIIIRVPIWLSNFSDVGVMLLAVCNSLKNRKVR